MCLSKLAKFKPCKVGYKLMGRSKAGDLLGEYYTTKAIPQDVWLNEEDFRLPRHSQRTGIPIGPNPGESYPFGWHVNHSKKDALRQIRRKDYVPLTCVKVEVREPVAVGYQSKRRITVAKQIKITGIVKEAR